MLDIYGRELKPGDFILSNAQKTSINGSFYGIYLSETSCLTVAPYQKDITDRTYLNCDDCDFFEYANLKSAYKIEQCDDLELQIYNKLNQVYKNRLFQIHSYEKNKKNLPVGTLLCSRNWKDIIIYLGCFYSCNRFTTFSEFSPKFVNVPEAEDLYCKSTVINSLKPNYVYLSLRDILCYNTDTLLDFLEGRKCGDDLINLISTQRYMNIEYRLTPMKNEYVMCYLDISSLFNNTASELDKLKSKYVSIIDPYSIRGDLSEVTDKVSFDKVVDFNKSSNLLINTGNAILILS